VVGQAKLVDLFLGEAVYRLTAYLLQAQTVDEVPPLVAYIR
jgi:hypothetical protein